RLGLYVFADGALVVAPGTVHPQQGNPPRVGPLRIEIDVVLVSRQALAVPLHGHFPWARLPQPLLQLRSEPGLGRAARTALATRPRLDAVGTSEYQLTDAIAREY